MVTLLQLRLNWLFVRTRKVMLLPYDSYLLHQATQSLAKFSSAALVARVSTESSTQKPSILSKQRTKLIRIARGYREDDLNNNPNIKNIKENELRVLRCFPLRELNFPSLQVSVKEGVNAALATPNEFHQLLCRKIRTSTERIYLASLYVGPAAEEIIPDEQGYVNLMYPKERELLQALQEAAAKRDNNDNRLVDIKILLDQSRALRPVAIRCSNQVTPISQSRTITSASACYRCLHPTTKTGHQSIDDSLNSKRDLLARSDSGVYLISVLSKWLQKILPNPYNEIAGVFHVKCYIFDNDMILSGANLSEEYFTNRTDRYLWITDDDQELHLGGRVQKSDRCTKGRRSAPDSSNLNSPHRQRRDNANIDSNTLHLGIRSNDSGLVQCYADMIQSLCKHGEQYTEENPEKYLDARTNTKGLDFANIFSSLSAKTSLSNYSYLPQGSAQHLLKSLFQILTVPVHEAENIPYDDDTIIAFAIPTLQFPNSFLNEFPSKPNSSAMPSDIDVICRMIRYNALHPKSSDSSRSPVVAANEKNQQLQCHSEFRLATAYFNPTMSFLHSIKDTSIIHFVSAGMLSHGFRPKKAIVSSNADNRNPSSRSRTDFIPAMFDTLSRQTVSTIRLWKELDASRNAIKGASMDDIRPATIDLWYYQRVDWTFHAKGIWLTQRESINSTDTTMRGNLGDSTMTGKKSFNTNSDATMTTKETKDTLMKKNQSLLIGDPATLCAVTTGSSNYGSRSEIFDMESNLILIFPDYPTVSEITGRSTQTSTKTRRTNKCQLLFAEEWNRICQYVEPHENEKMLPLSLFWTILLPWVRPFF